MTRRSRLCTRCGKMRTVDDDSKKSEWYMRANGTPKPPCRECQLANRRERYQETRNVKNAEFGSPSLTASGSWIYKRVTVKWCPRDEWPRLRYFSHGQFEAMLEEGILTPGMHVTQHDKTYVVWGPKGTEQWMQPLR